jgi:hypothetical protein
MRKPNERTGLRHAAAAAVLIALGGNVGAVARPAAAAEGPQLRLPIACTPGEDCFIIQYVDVDPGPERLDYMCGWLSYDGAAGTDFGLADMQAMRRGVAVLAAADGVVAAVRDGMDDVSVREAGAAEALAGKDCGNGVTIDHGDGWMTQTCHLRRNSVAVRQGDRVRAGDRIGLVGLSGRTEFPHVELSVRYRGKPVDPFVGMTRDARCGPGARPLWAADVLASLPYRSAILANAGFAEAPPDTRAARDGLYDATEASPEAAALILWTDIYWPRPGDRILLQITGPDGRTLFEHTTTVEDKIARNIFYGGARYTGRPWPAGSYQGRVHLSRDAGPIGREEHTLSRTLTVR